MPLLEFACASGHRQDILFRTFAAAEKAPVSVQCTVCRETALRVEYPRTLEPHFYGNPDGYHKPSPTLRTSYKLASERGNRDSIG